MGVLRIGVDIGGTNTDAVLMDGTQVVASTKRSTTAEVGDAIVAAVTDLLEASSCPTGRIDAVMIGTTHFTNAVVERKDLLEVAVIRAALPAARDLPPFTDWPEDLTAVVGTHCYEVAGGYEYDGREIATLDEAAVREAARDIRRKGLRSVVASCVFAPLNPAMEVRIAEILRQEAPNVLVTLSNKVGGIGMLERENAAIFNASLLALAQTVVGSLKDAFRSFDLGAYVFFSQNDGTLMNAETVLRYPVHTFVSGPTNSMRGAAFLSGVREAVVVDIGGTTTDVGVLVNGFPRESAIHLELGGVRTNFRMPDILSIGLGGGSRVRQGERVTIGPDSVGYRITEESLVFAGGSLTATDVAVAAGLADVGDGARVAGLDRALVAAAVEEIQRRVEETVDRTKSSAAALPVVLVGGGAILLGQKKIAGASEVMRPQHSAVANAIGAAIAQIGGEVDRVYSYEALGREKALEQARQEAKEAAVHAGAEPDTVEIVAVEELPLAYLPGRAVRLRIKAVGNPVALTETTA